MNLCKRCKYISWKELKNGLQKSIRTFLRFVKTSTKWRITMKQYNLRFVQKRAQKSIKCTYPKIHTENEYKVYVHFLRVFRHEMVAKSSQPNSEEIKNLVILSDFWKWLGWEHFSTPLYVHVYLYACIFY